MRRLLLMRLRRLLKRNRLPRSFCVANNLNVSFRPISLSSSSSSAILPNNVPSSSYDNPSRRSLADAPTAADAIVASLKLESNQSPTLSKTGVLHSVAIKYGFPRTTQVGNGLLNLYLKVGSLRYAHDLFDEMPERDTLTWTLLLCGYSRDGKYIEALELFSQMLISGISPNHFTLSSALNCCSATGYGGLETGKCLHGWILRNGVLMDSVLQNSIIELYAKTGSVEYAEKVFELMENKDALSWNIMIHAYLRRGGTLQSMELFKKSPKKDISTWNTMIYGHIESGSPTKALLLFHYMVRTGTRINHFTLSIALVLASTLVYLELGKQIHASILRIGYDHDEFITNALVDMYCKCGKMEASSIIFGRMADSNQAKPVSWSSMIAGYVHNGMSEEGLKLFHRMVENGLEIDLFTLTTTVSACSGFGILQQGRQVHACVEKLGHFCDIFLSSAIIDMYSKCGSLKEARRVFDRINTHNVVSWTSIIGSYALHGEGKEALRLFNSMIEENIKPNEVTFLAILSACSHTGLVKDGYEHFKSMKDDYGLVPKIEHLTCMVDLLGRAGLIDEAKEFIFRNNISNQSVAWKALLSACRTQNDFPTGVFAGRKLIQLEPNEVGSYVLLSNVMASKKNWVEGHQLRKSSQSMKIPGQSWIHIKGKIHTFVAGDRTHPQAGEIFSYLENLLSKLKELGFSSKTEFVVHDLEEEEQRESVLSFHSEKLAIAFGIITTPFGSTLRVMKNLRICGDCHEAIKYITLVTCREIIVRDAKRFHSFRNGKCSCGDYW